MKKICYDDVVASSDLRVIFRFRHNVRISNFLENSSYHYLM